MVVNDEKYIRRMVRKEEQHNKERVKSETKRGNGTNDDDFDVLQLLRI